MKTQKPREIAGHPANGRASGANEPVLSRPGSTPSRRRPRGALRCAFACVLVPWVSGCYEQFSNIYTVVESSTQVLSPKPLDLEVDLDGEAALAYVYNAPDLIVNVRYAEYPYKNWSNPGQQLYDVDWYLDGRPWEVEEAFVTATDLLMDAEDSSYRYATVSFFVMEIINGFPIPSSHCRFLRSVDGGASWTVNSDMLMSGADGALVAQNPSNPDVMVFAYEKIGAEEIRVDISDDRGETFDYWGTTYVAHEESYPGVHIDLLDIAYAPSGYLYVFYARTQSVGQGDDSVSFWIKRSGTHGVTWDLATRIDDGIPGYNIDNLGGDLQLNGGALHAAWGDGYFINNAYTVDNGETWTEDERLASDGYSHHEQPALSAHAVNSALILSYQSVSPIRPGGYNVKYHGFDGDWSQSGRVNNRLGAVDAFPGNFLTVDGAGNFIQAFSYHNSLKDESRSLGVAINTEEPGELVSPLSLVVDESTAFTETSPGDTIRFEYQVTNNGDEPIKPTIGFRYQTKSGKTGVINDMRGRGWHAFLRPLDSGETSAVKDFMYKVGSGVPAGTYRLGVLAGAGMSPGDFRELETFRVDVVPLD